MSEVDFKILELREQITTLEVQKNELQFAMQAQLQLKQQAVEKRRSQARLLRRKEQLELAITLLTERKEASQAECEQLRASNDERRDALAHAKMRLAQARRETVDETLQPVTQALMWHYSEKAKKVSKLRRALIKQLIDLFQVGEDDEGRPTIVGIKLDPDRLTQGRDYRGDDRTPLESISSGLGWVVHFLECVCTYLDVVPPHSMTFHGSKSTIGGVDGSKYELVADGNGIRQETFKIAVRLLNTNVCWLCGLAGDRPPREKANRLLENLKRLSEASRLGWEGPLRIVQPHTDSDVDDLQFQLQGDGAVGGMGEQEPEPESDMYGETDTSSHHQVALPAVGGDDAPLASPPDFSAPFPGTDIRDSRAVRYAGRDGGGPVGGVASPAVGGYGGGAR